MSAQTPQPRPPVPAGRSKAGLTRLLVLLVKFYQASLSPLLGCNCRYEPTCSEYMIEALARYGAWKGTWLGLRRLLRCHPFSAGGYDPVP